MKLLHYVLGVSVLIFGSDLIFITETSRLNACPRCRRALPKGPRKHSHPGFSGRHEKPAVAKVIADQALNSCSGSCCCAQQKTPSVRLSQNKNEESVNG
jgi:hypothetical protein